jgi:hypothetical protein
LQTKAQPTGLFRQLSEEVQMPNKYMKECSTSLTIKKIQIKTILRIHLTQVRMAIIKKTTKARKDTKEKEIFIPYKVGMKLV